MSERLRSPRAPTRVAVAAPALPRDKFLKATREEWESYFEGGRVDASQVPAVRRHIQLVDDANRATTPEQRERRTRAARLSAKHLGLDRPAITTVELPPGDYRRPRKDPRDGFAPSMMIPSYDAKNRPPTLGPQLVSWIEHFLVFGQGDRHGDPAQVDLDKQAIIYRAYELRPDGRRRFQRVMVSWRKGFGKSEAFIGWLGAAELHPSAPVRFDHWAKRGEVSSWGYHFQRGEPVGRGVSDPVAFLMATTERQAEQVGYGTLRAILLESPGIRDAFDIGEDRIRCANGTGFAAAISTAPNPADGRLTSWMALDETGRLTKHQRTHDALLGNLSKRRDSWAMETTTSPAAGEGSIGEQAREYADSVAAGDAADPSLLYVHQQAAQTRELETDEQVREALLEAAGPCMAKWWDPSGAIALFRDPNHDQAYWRRVQLNQVGVHSSDRVFDFNLTVEAFWPEKNLEITIGFDGSYNNDSTFLVAQSMRTGNQWVLGAWVRPDNPEPGWMVDHGEVDEQLKAAFHHFKVIRVFCDQFFCPNLPTWQGRWNTDGKKVVYGIETGKVPGSELLQAFLQRLRAGEVKIANDKRLLSAFAAAVRKELPSTNAEGENRFLMAKQKHGAKIDAAVAAMLASAACEHAVRAGAARHFGSQPGRTTVHFG